MIGFPGGYYQWFWDIMSKVLPTVYDDTLSYYECLQKLRYAIGQFGKALDDALSELTTATEAAEASADASEASADAAAASATEASESAGVAQQAVSQLITTDLSQNVTHNTDYFASSTAIAKKYGNVVCVNIYATVKAGVTELPKNTALFTGLPWKSSMGDVLYFNTVAKVESLNDVYAPEVYTIRRSISQSTTAELKLDTDLTVEGGNRIYFSATYLLD